MMDFDAFYAATAEAYRLLPYDSYGVGLTGPRPDAGAPTAEWLQEATDKLIGFEDMAAQIPALLDGLDDLASRLNYHYDPEWAALPDDQAGSYFADGIVPYRTMPSFVRSSYDGAVARLAEVRASLNAYAQIIQTMVSLWTAARAKIEHDLGWQSYVQERFGIDPASVPRDVKCVVPIQEPETCN